MSAALDTLFEHLDRASTDAPRAAPSVESGAYSIAFASPTFPRMDSPTSSLLALEAMTNDEGPAASTPRLAGAWRWIRLLAEVDDAAAEVLFWEPLDPRAVKYVDAVKRFSAAIACELHDLLDIELGAAVSWGLTWRSVAALIELVFAVEVAPEARALQGATLPDGEAAALARLVAEVEWLAWNVREAASGERALARETG